MKIAMMTNNYKPFVGGVPISIDRLATELRKLGHIVYIFAPRFEGEEEEEYVIRYHSLKRKLKKEFTIPNIFDPIIEEKFREISFDIIHVHHPMLIGYIAQHLGKKYNVPVVLTYHTRYEHYLHYLKPFERKKTSRIDKLDNINKKHEELLQEEILTASAYYKQTKPAALRRRLVSAGKEGLVAAHNRLVINRCSMVFAPSMSMKEYLMDHGTVTDIGILPTGIPQEEFDYDAAAASELRKRYGKDVEHLFCSVSRLEKEKNIEFMLEGLKRFKERKGGSFRLLLIGKGSRRDLLRERVQELGLEDNVIFCGCVPHEELRNYYHACDAFLFASTSETQGIVLLEAMAAGLPVIAVAASGVSDVVIDAYNGYTSAPKVEEWTDKLMLFTDQPGQWEKMKLRAYMTAREYLASKIASKALQYYQNILYYKRMEPEYEYANSYESAGGLISYLPEHNRENRYGRSKKQRTH